VTVGWSRGRPASPSTRQIPALDPPPQEGEPVAELQRLAEVPLPGLGGQADRGGELGDRVLRDRRSPVAGELEVGLAAALEDERGRFVEGVRGMSQHPLHREDQQVGRCSVGGKATGSGGSQETGGRVRPVPRLLCAPSSCSYWYEIRVHRQFRPGSGVVHRGQRNCFKGFFWRGLFGSSSASTPNPG
jgi:hypothetical protein